MIGGVLILASRMGDIALLAQPFQHIGNGPEYRPRGQLRAVDQDHRNPKSSRRFQLGLCPRAARVLGDDMGDAVALQQGQIPGFGEGAAGDHGLGIRQGQGAFGRIDKTQQIRVLRLVDELRNMQLADCQKDPRRGLWQGIGCGAHIGNGVPDVTLARDPWRPLEGANAGVCQRAGLDRIAAHLGGKRMGRVHQMRHPFAPDVSGQPFGPAKAADTGGQGLGRRLFRAACIGKDRLDPGLGYGAGQKRGFGGATEDKESRHG